MSDPTLVDVDGPAAPPRRNGELAFDHPWQGRLFATTMALCDSGRLDFGVFRKRLIAEVARGGDEYWAHWQDALEGLLADQGVCGEDELGRRAEQFAEHG